jgi:mannosyltransferase
VTLPSQSPHPVPGAGQVAAGRGGAGQAAAGDGAAGAGQVRPAGRDSGWVIGGVPALAALAVMLTGIGRSSFWADEASTLSATERPFPQMLRLLSHLDTVHGAYYLLMWVVVRVAGTGEVAVRLPSAVSMAVAAGAIALLGRRLASARAGLMAGLVFAALPQVSWYGQEARGYALVMALAVITTYLFVRVLDAPPGARHGWLTGYGASVAALGLGNLFALLLVPAHALALAACRRGGPQRPPVAGWLAAAAAGVAATTPVMVLGWQERNQISWIKPVGAAALRSLVGLVGPPGVVVGALVVTAAAIAIRAAEGKARLGGGWPWRLIAVCVPWLLLPPAVLLAISLIHPVYTPRYVAFCLPAFALLVGNGLAALGRVAGPAALILIVVLVLPAQAGVRGADGHGQNLRRISQILATQAHRGDGVLFASHFARKIEIAYPAGFRRVRDVSLGVSAIQKAEPTAANAPPQVIIRRLATVSRLWVIQILKHRQSLPPVRRLGFRFVRAWTVTGFRVAFYART